MIKLTTGKPMEKLSRFSVEECSPCVPIISSVEECSPCVPIISSVEECSPCVPIISSVLREAGDFCFSKLDFPLNFQ